MSGVGVVINFCSNERLFINQVLEQCSKFTKHIVVSYGSHMYDGTPESENIKGTIDYLKFKYPSVAFLEYKVDLTIPHSDLKGVVKRPTAYWCNLARWQGIQHLKAVVDWFLFLDADEIPEGDVLGEWFAEAKLQERNVYKLANYWYFKSPHNQAERYEDSILLVHKMHLTEDAVFHDDERDGIISVSQASQIRMVMSKNNKPMIHHYSWVRTKEGIAKKLKTWAHRDDIFKNANIESIIDFMYKNEDVNDFVHNYTYNKVENRFQILL